MESRTWVKFSHIIVFLLLATSFETLMAQSERDKLRDGLEVIQLLKEVKSIESDDLGCKGKQRWPELIGVPAKLAKETIEKGNPLINVQIILNGSPVTADFSCFRVRLAVNVLNIVVQVPVVT